MSRVSGTMNQPRPAQHAPPQKELDPETPLLNEIMLAQVARLEKASASIGSQLNDPAVSRMQHSILKGVAISRLKAMITPDILRILTSLMNTKHGFKTDRGPKQRKPEAQQPYPADTVIDCAIAALLDGVLWAGNQFNIIAGECYITGEGWEYKLFNLPGFTDLVPFPGTPVLENGNARVRFGASWKYKGVARRLEDAKGEPGVVFAIKSDQFSGPDQIIGKARAKALKLIYKTLTSSIQTFTADEPMDIVEDDIVEDDMNAGRGVITDAQEAALNAAIAEHEASAVLIRDFYGLATGQRLLATEFDACMAKVKNGDFSAPSEKAAPSLAEGELPNDEETGDLAEYSSEEVDLALVTAGLVPWEVYKVRYKQKRAADLNQDQRREIMAECERMVAR